MSTMEKNSCVRMETSIIRRYCVIIYTGHIRPPNFCLISFRSLLYTPNPCFYADIIIIFFRCAGNVCVWVPVECLYSVANDSVHAMQVQGGRSGLQWLYFCKYFVKRNMSVRPIIFMVQY